MKQTTISQYQAVKARLDTERAKVEYLLRTYGQCLWENKYGLLNAYKAHYGSIEGKEETIMRRYREIRQSGGVC